MLFVAQESLLPPQETHGTETPREEWGSLSVSGLDQTLADGVRC